MSRRRLGRRFFRRSTEDVARELLGTHLVRVVEGRRSVVRIVEVEAYLGIEDPAAHTFRGRRTLRVEPMWQDGGTSYVFVVYGLHRCFNVVTMTAGVPEAVLVRAGEPVEGLDDMKRRRGRWGDPDQSLAAGPGRLCRALGIDESLSGADLVTGPDLFLEPGRAVGRDDVETAARVGVSYAGAAAAWPLRYFLKDSDCVSVGPSGSGRRSGPADPG